MVKMSNMPEVDFEHALDKGIALADLFGSWGPSVLIRKTLSFLVAGQRLLNEVLIAMHDLPGFRHRDERGRIHFIH